ncbi:MAG: Zn-dependent hydrolase of the beta-lactamase fold-like protein [Candidatus Curtissbacteria bacterium GW2011_GWA1_41_11]|uniref:Zn-dependent hydrolase of the beta-lactamase fold-like protein n=1 Tax=Candidatus Curtissbacteria bacterium GW2011_GWA1_41_11 TaxID=1618409 RepID=A0A0G0UDK7_9BACT|nr:MAG: Zn-dependent hydrolase of the beta-lactamase fold-like protein [Candidatus Curtissbacteria bacterium GW2011_GWA1_41_11]
MVDIWWYGQSCFKVKGKNASVVFDPYDSNFTGLKPLKLDANIVCVTHDHGDHNNVSAVKGAEEGETAFVVSGPGEYEKTGVNVVGIQGFHDDNKGSERGKNTIYFVTIDEINIVHLGDLGQKNLTQDQIEELSPCDVLMIPVGGVYTITSKEAPDIISALEPKIVIPMHYKTTGLKFNLDAVDNFLKALGKEPEPVSKLSLSREKLPEELEVVVLEMQ